MADSPRGKPVRSRDLSRRFQEEASRLAGAEETVESVRTAVRQTQLALQARRKRAPKGKASSAEHGAHYVDVQPGAGASRVGPFATARRLSSTSVFYSAPTGTGAIRALREGEVWAQPTGSRQETFEARSEPGRLMEYNEVLVPHIAGKVSLRFHHDQGTDRYGPFEESQLIRLSSSRRFNGRIEIDSRSRSTVGGEYIHALGGLEIRDSDWTGAWELLATMEAPTGGTIELTGLVAHPSGRSLPFSVEDPSGTELTKTETVSEGQTLVLRAEDTDPLVSASQAKIEYSYI